MNTIHFGSTFTFSLNQELHKKSDKAEYRKDKFNEIIEQRFPNSYTKSKNSDYMCISVKEKSDVVIKNILDKYGFKFYKISGKHNLSKDEMNNSLLRYIKHNG